MAALDGLTKMEKDDLVVSLSALLCADAGAELTADNLNSAISASGNSVAPHIVPVVVGVLEKSEGVDKFCHAPGAGGGGGGGGGGGDAGGAAAEAKPEEKEEEEEEEIDMGGGMDMFGDGGGGDDY